MIAFQVFVNGRRICTAGIGNNGVLDANVVWLGRGGDGRFRLSVGGLNSSTNEHLRYETPTINMGDEITVRVIEADAERVDLPIEHRPRKPTSSVPENPSRVDLPPSNN